MSRNSRVQELRHSLFNGLLRKVFCKVCGAELGVVNSAFYGFGMYCTRCTNAVARRARP